MKKTPLRRISEKTKKRNQAFKVSFVQHLEEEGYNCRWCRLYGTLSHPSNPLTPHHIDRDRNNTAYENCYPCHLFCHSLITNRGIDVREYLDLEAWLKDNPEFRDKLNLYGIRRAND